MLLRQLSLFAESSIWAHLLESPDASASFIRVSASNDVSSLRTSGNSVVGSLVPPASSGVLMAVGSVVVLISVSVEDGVAGDLVDSSVSVISEHAESKNTPIDRLISSFFIMICLEIQSFCMIGIFLFADKIPVLLFRRFVI